MKMVLPFKYVEKSGMESIIFVLIRFDLWFLNQLIVRYDFI
jgi:hypothetical protein